MTTTEAAKLLGITRQMVSRHCGNGAIVAEKQGRDWIITPENLKAFQDRRRKPGRPVRLTKYRQ